MEYCFLVTYSSHFCPDFFHIWQVACYGTGLATLFLVGFMSRLGLCYKMCNVTCFRGTLYIFFRFLFISSLCGVGVRVRLNNFSSKTTRPRDMLFFLKDTLSIEDEKLFKACKSVCSSVCYSHCKGDTPTKSVKISILYHNFLSDYYRDFSHILHICTRPQVDSLV